MQAFHNKESIKKKYVARIMAHKKSDEIIKGLYWEKGKGCAVGCTIHSSNHSTYETEHGIPTVLARLEDRIFEGLPLELAKTWPERFLKSIKVGADLSKVWTKFAIWLLTDKENGVLKYAKKQSQIYAIQNVSDLYKRSLTESVSIDEFKAAAAARSQAYIKQSEKLLELLKKAK